MSTNRRPWFSLSLLLCLACVPEEERNPPPVGSGGGGPMGVHETATETDTDATSTTGGLECRAVCDPMVIETPLPELQECNCACPYLCRFDTKDMSFSRVAELACGLSDQPFDADGITVRCLPAIDGIETCGDICQPYATLDECIEGRGVAYCLGYYAGLCGCGDS